MKEKIYKLLSTWRFWLGFQILLIIILNVIGHVREGNNPLTLFFWQRFPEVIVGFVATVLGFPAGMYCFSWDGFEINRTWLYGIFIAYIVPLVYYPLFLLLVRYITKRKHFWKIIAIGLTVFMILSFVGCSRIVQIPLIVT